jgi:hypothetical protein
MKTLNTITNNIAKELKLSNVEHYGSTEIDTFIQNAKRYVKAVKQRRIICKIDTVSSSGMSRTIKFLECSGSVKTGFNYLNFYQLFDQLGFSKVRNNDTFRIHGCGMDMIFHTNYTIIHRLWRLGFISKKECEYLAQMTPSVI